MTLRPGPEGPSATQRGHPPWNKFADSEQGPAGGSQVEPILPATCQDARQVNGDTSGTVQAQVC